MEPIRKKFPILMFDVNHLIPSHTVTWDSRGVHIFMIFLMEILVMNIANRNLIAEPKHYF
jgi:hypothetical protein